MARFAPIFIGFASLLVAGKTFIVDGIVTGVDHIRRVITVAHRPVPGMMPAMTMKFGLEEGANAPSPGDRVRFAIHENRRPWIATSLQRIQADTGGIPKPPETLAVGQPFPSFELTSQRGESIRLADLRGRLVLLQFIYTRCPLADVCPRLAANFAALQKRFAALLGKDLVLISITIDPEHDSPDVLRAYAKQWNAQPGWHFLTGPLRQIALLAGASGLVFWPDEGAIGHTSATVLLNRDGSVGATLDGSSYRVDQLASLVTRHLEDTK